MRIFLDPSANAGDRATSSIQPEKKGTSRIGIGRHACLLHVAPFFPLKDFHGNDLPIPAKRTIIFSRCTDHYINETVSRQCL
jgi:hypothetical protein